MALVALASTAARIPGGIVRGHATLALREGLEASQAGDDARKSGDAAGAAAHYATALDRYQASARFLEERPDDLGLLAVAVTATWDAADTTIHHGAHPLDAAAGFERTLRLLERLGRRSRGGIDVLARIELGRLALRDPADPPAGVERARKWLAEAMAVPDAEFDGAYRSARQRLLESAIRLRDPDGAVADQARRDLEHQTKPGGRLGGVAGARPRRRRRAPPRARAIAPLRARVAAPSERAPTSTTKPRGPDSATVKVAAAAAPPARRTAHAASSAPSVRARFSGSRAR